MSDQQQTTYPIYKERKVIRQGNISGSIYGIAFIGALVYYMKHAVTFGAGVIGFLKAIIWPAMLVYYLMDYLKM